MCMVCVRECSCDMHASVCMYLCKDVCMCMSFNSCKCLEFSGFLIKYIVCHELNVCWTLIVWMGSVLVF